MNPISAWNRFLFGPISARPLGAFRIVFGLSLLAYLALMSVEFDYWYTGAGLLQGNEAREAAGQFRLSPLNFTQNPTVAHAFFAVTVAAAVAVTFGWRTRVMSVVLYLGMLSLYHRNVTGNGGPDAVPMLMSFYIMLCPSGAAFSLDVVRAAKKRGTAAEALIAPWGLRLLQMQVCLLYFQSCVIKCDGLSWMNGTAVHYVLFNREFGLFDMEWMAQYPLLINLLTHGAVLIEFALAFWLWFRPTRRWVMLAGVALHMGIHPVLNVAGFGETLIATYLVFLAPDELNALIGFLDPRGWLARLGIRTPSLAFWGGLDGPSGLQGLHQLELPFEMAEVQARAEAITTA